MSRKGLSYLLLSIIVLGSCVNKRANSELLEQLFNESISYRKPKIERYSKRFENRDADVLNNIFTNDPELRERKGEVANIVSNKEEAIGVIKALFTNQELYDWAEWEPLLAREYKNLWLVYGCSINRLKDDTVYRELFVIMSRHTAEILHVTTGTTSDNEVF